MKIFRGDQNELSKRFQVSTLVAVRVGALRRKGIYLSEALLELIRMEKAAERLILDRALLSDDFGPQTLSALQQQYQLAESFPLILEEQGEERILALEEERLAEEGWEQSRHEALACQSEQASSLVFPNHRHLQELFSQEDIEQLKMELITTVDPLRKIEALRKLALTSIPRENKAFMLLHALIDHAPQVRSEAAGFLKELGFRQELCEAIKLLAGGDNNQKRLAIGMLNKLVAESNEIERATIFQTLLLSLNDQAYKEVMPALVEALSHVVTYAPMNEENFEIVVAKLIEVLVSDFDRLLLPVAAVMKSLAQLQPSMFSRLLWKRVQQTEQSRLKAFLLGLLGEGEIEPRLRKELVAAICQEAGRGPELDPVYLRLTNVLIELAQEAVDPLLQRLEQSQGLDERVYLIHLLDDLMNKGQARTSQKNKVFKCFIQIFRVSSYALRKAVLDARLTLAPDVAKNLQTELATEYLADIQQPRIDGWFYEVKAALVKMGVPAIKPLKNTITRPQRPEQARLAAAILGDLILALPAEASFDGEQMFTFVNKQLKNAGEEKGELYKILGKLAATSHVTPALCQRISAQLQQTVLKTSFTYEVVESLGWCASGVHASLDDKLSVCHLLTSLLNHRLPQNLATINEQDGVIAIDLGPATKAYTELIPILLHSLHRIALAPSTKSALRENIVQVLLHKWEELMSYKVIWGPQNTTELAECMGSLCQSPLIEDNLKIKIGEALIQKFDLLSIIKVLAKMFPQIEVVSPRMLNLIEKTARQLLNLIQDEDYSNEEDQEWLLECIGMLSGCRLLAPKQRESEYLRERLLYSLFEGLRKGFFVARKYLQILQQAQWLSKRLQKEIAKHLPRGKEALLQLKVTRPQ